MSELRELIEHEVAKALIMAALTPTGVQRDIPAEVADDMLDIMEHRDYGVIEDRGQAIERMFQWWFRIYDNEGDLKQEIMRHTEAEVRGWLGDLLAAAEGRE